MSSPTVLTRAERQAQTRAALLDAAHALIVQRGFEGTSVVAAAGREPPADPRTLGTAFIALDIGLALQNWVDPDAVGAEHYPELYELLFTPLLRGQKGPEK